jgi:hypothetical protein
MGSRLLGVAKLSNLAMAKRADKVFSDSEGHSPVGARRWPICRDGYRLATDRNKPGFAYDKGDKHELRASPRLYPNLKTEGPLLDVTLIEKEHLSFHAGCGSSITENT